MHGKDSFDRDCVCVCTGRRDLCKHAGLCMSVCVCCDCVFIVCFGTEMSCGTHNSRVGIASI